MTPLRHHSRRWSSVATRHWRTCPISNTWVAGCKATGGGGGAGEEADAGHRLEVAQSAFSSLASLNIVFSVITSSTGQNSRASHPAHTNGQVKFLNRDSVPYGRPCDQPCVTQEDFLHWR